MLSWLEISRERETHSPSKLSKLFLISKVFEAYLILSIVPFIMLLTRKTDKHVQSDNLSRNLLICKIYNINSVIINGQLHVECEQQKARCVNKHWYIKLMWLNGPHLQTQTGWEDHLRGAGCRSDTGEARRQHCLALECVLWTVPELCLLRPLGRWKETGLSVSVSTEREHGACARKTSTSCAHDSDSHLFNR